MRVSATWGDLTDEQRFMVQRRAWLSKRAQQAVKAASFAVERRVKSEMPVDTGRARASWGHWTPGDLRGPSEASPADAHWKEDDSGLSTEQGSNLPYIDALNDGSSMQAPAGFLDRAAEAGQRELDKLIDDIMGEW
jgi:hypothetical protein